MRDKPLSKTEIRERIEKSYKDLTYELLSVRERDWEKKLRKDWNWTLHDLLAHLIGWDEGCLKAAKDFLKRKRPEYDGFEDRVYNEKFVKLYSKLSRELLLKRFFKSREAISRFLKSLSIKQIKGANTQGFIWNNYHGSKQPRLTLDSILDLSWHDKEHIIDIQKFKRETLSLTLNEKIEIYFFPKPPFHFDYSFYNPSHFKTSDVKWKSSFKWQTFLWQGKLLGLKFENKSSSPKPKVKLTIFSKNKLTETFVESLKTEIVWRYNLDYDLKEFYKTAGPEPLLESIISKYKGMRIFHQGSLYEYFVIGIVLQNAPIHRTIKMMQSLFDRFGKSVKFDNRYFSSFWDPKEILQSSDKELRNLKLGYRAKALLDISRLFANQEIDEVKLRNFPEEEQESRLLSIPGIGIATTQYILGDCLHRYAELKHVPNWERKLYSRIFFKSKQVLSEKRVLSFLNNKFGKHTKLAVHYF
ncbi:MAG: ClbS/DfsB family four-helix bundle protein [Patescibacteria group bacterium]|nr:ClbS/DfsB family four-helix bundle protein [Patescibacteria group bacterium]